MIVVEIDCMILLMTSQFDIIYFNLDFWKWLYQCLIPFQHNVECQEWVRVDHYQSTVHVSYQTWNILYHTFQAKPSQIHTFQKWGKINENIYHPTQQPYKNRKTYRSVNMALRHLRIVRGYRIYLWLNVLPLATPSLNKLHLIRTNGYRTSELGDLGFTDHETDYFTGVLRLKRHTKVIKT